MSTPQLFAMQLAGFSPGSQLEVAKGNFRGIGFGGKARVSKFDESALELDVTVSKLLINIDVKLQFRVDSRGTPIFWGGRPDGKKTGKEPAHFQHTMDVVSHTADGSLFDLNLEDPETGNVTKKPVAIEKTQVQGSDAMRIIYDRYELTLVPQRAR